MRPVLNQINAKHLRPQAQSGEQRVRSTIFKSQVSSIKFRVSILILIQQTLHHFQNFTIFIYLPKEGMDVDYEKK